MPRTRGCRWRSLSGSPPSVFGLPVPTSPSSAAHRPPDAACPLASAPAEQADLERHGLLSDRVEACLGVANEQIEGHGWSLEDVDPAGDLAPGCPPATRRISRH